jgi:hypothetical protein
MSDYIPHDSKDRAKNLKDFHGKTPKEIKEARWYHGTDQDFSEFIPHQASAIYVTPDPKFASGWAEDLKRGYDPNVMPLHVRAEKPFDYENRKHINALIQELGPDLIFDPQLKDFVDEVRQGYWEAIESPPIQSAIRAMGHDSFYVKEADDNGNATKNLAVYDPSQIKSATGNQGTYDPNDPDITKAEGGEVDDLPPQSVTSEKTSLRQIPALHKSPVFEAVPGQTNVDIGGGAYDLGTEYLAKERGIESHVFDPFNRSQEHNDAVIKNFSKNPAHTATVANVLNVIPEREHRIGAIKRAHQLTRDDGKAYFGIYEGDRSGNGAVTSKGWQNNRPAVGYVDEVKEVFPHVERKGNIIIGHKSAPNKAEGGEIDDGITAYHGSPYDFDKFDISKIGTGEGAQSYGHGLYFAQAEPTAQKYRDDLAHKANPQLIVDDQIFDVRTGGGFHHQKEDLIYRLWKDRVTHEVDYQGKYPWTAQDTNDAIDLHASTFPNDVKDWAEKTFKGKELSLPKSGRMYEVQINAHPDHFLDWDKPLSEQPHAVRAFAKIHAGDDPLLQDLFSGDEIPMEYFGLFPKSKGSQAYNTLADSLGGPEKAAQALHEAGVKGVKYFDQRSRAEGEGTRNYVVFDDKLVNVKRKYAQGGDVDDGITAYHGTPHDFDEFDISKIGTGEGAQAYGHGLYFAESPDVARGYRDTLTAREGMPQDLKIGGRDVYNVYQDIENRASRMSPKAAEPEYDKMSALELLMQHGDIPGLREAAEAGQITPDTMAWVEKEVAPKFTRAGRLFQVSINAHPDHFLDWDKPLSEQSQYIQDALSQHSKANRLFGNDVVKGELVEPTGQSILNRLLGRAEEKSQQLHDLGIKGIKYLDQGSRGDGEGSRNYVVFDHNLVKVKGKYARGGAADKDGVVRKSLKLLQDEFPTIYMPKVGRQVMQDGGVPAEMPRQSLRDMVASILDSRKRPGQRQERASGGEVEGKYEPNSDQAMMDAMRIAKEERDREAASQPVVDPMGGIAMPPAQNTAEPGIYDRAMDVIGRTAGAVGEPIRAGMERYGHQTYEAAQDAARLARESGAQSVEQLKTGQYPAALSSLGWQGIYTIGIPFSPVTGAAKILDEEATKITGNPVFGSKLGFAAEFADPSHAGMLARGANRARELAQMMKPEDLAKFAIFAGPKTADPVAQAARQRAIAMRQSEGAFPGEVWQETLWGERPNKQEFYEIPDQNSKYDPLGYLNWHANYYGMTPEAVVNTGTIAPQLDSVFRHDELYRAYPELKNTPVIFENAAQHDRMKGQLGFDYGGYYDPSTKSIVLAPKVALDPQAGRSVILHEIQHVVQDIEGAPTGTNVAVATQAREYATKIYGEASQRAAQAAEVNSNRAKYILEEMQTFGPDYRPSPRIAPALEMAEQIKKDYPNFTDQMALETALNHFDPEYQAASKTRYEYGSMAYAEPYEIYERKAGEVEARNVQERMDMPTEERRQRAPWVTQDTFYDQQFENLPGPYGLKSYAPAASAAPQIERQVSPLGFYSVGREAALGLKQEKGAPQQMVAMLKSGGVKPVELENAGILDAEGNLAPDWAGRKNVTRDELAEAIQKGNPEIKETVFANPEGFESTYKPYEITDYFDELPEGSNRIWDIGNSERRGESYQIHELNNGEYAIYDETGYYVGDESSLQDAVDYINRDIAETRRYYYGDNQPKFEEYTLPGGTNYREVVLHTPEGENSFTESHHNVPNALLHMRMKDRIGNDGEKMLHIDEVQSDWAQKGRDQGFNVKGDQKAFDEAQTKLVDLHEAQEKTKKDALAVYIEDLKTEIAEFDKLNPEGKGYEKAALEAALADAERGFSSGSAVRIDNAYYSFKNSLPFMDEAKAAKYYPYIDKVEQKSIELLDQMDVYNQLSNALQNPIPKGPYVQKTEQWVDLALKRAMNEAQKGGYDKIAFTQGVDQADRYGLHKQLNRIEVMPQGEGKWKVSAILPNGQEFPRASGRMDEKKISEMFGKDIADRIKAGDFTGKSGNTSYIEGDDLRGGGTGMFKFYDEIVPKRTRELLKKLDKEAQVKTEFINTRDEPWPFPIEIAHDGDKYWLKSKDPRQSNTGTHRISPNYKSYEEADNIRRGFTEGRTTPVYTVEMTPKLKEAIGKGLPAYKRGGSVVDKALMLTSKYA